MGEHSQFRNRSDGELCEGDHHYVAVDGSDIGHEDFDGPMVCIRCGDSVDSDSDSRPGGSDADNA